ATALTEYVRGEVWLVSLGAGRPGEPAKNRPAVIVSSTVLNTGRPRDLVAIVPISASLAPSALRPEVPVSAGVKRASTAVCGAVRALASGRLLKRLGALDAATLAQVSDALGVILETAPVDRAR
ncbi:MAG: type II toxin-antitoxin system PemK/MazF family toxin, partial [Bifidobacteriaceae bacterium]|nr:type II toxin-antitoxin system PemK/MazF family toxin [Bifidobacteriaceae bacterium]